MHTQLPACSVLAVKEAEVVVEVETEVPGPLATQTIAAMSVKVAADRSNGSPATE